MESIHVVGFRSVCHGYNSVVHCFATLQEKEEMEERLGSAGEGRMAVATSGSISIWDARSMLVNTSV